MARFVVAGYHASFAMLLLASKIVHTQYISHCGHDPCLPDLQPFCSPVRFDHVVETYFQLQTVLRYHPLERTRS